MKDTEEKDVLNKAEFMKAIQKIENKYEAEELDYFVK
jgi:hypothetical protein